MAEPGQVSENYNGHHLVVIDLETSVNLFSNLTSDLSIVTTGIHPVYIFFENYWSL